MHVELISETTHDIFTNVFDTNVRGPYFLTQAILPHMPTGGRIILISSSSARLASKGAAMALYSASKAAIECLARTWAYEVRPILVIFHLHRLIFNSSLALVVLL